MLLVSLKFYLSLEWKLPAVLDPASVPGISLVSNYDGNTPLILTGNFLGLLPGISPISITLPLSSFTL